MTPHVDSPAFAARRLQALRALDRLLDDFRDRKAKFGSVRLEVMFQHGLPYRQVVTLEVGGPLGERDGGARR
jgi:hypothetical protein